MKKFFTRADPVIPVHHPRVLVETAVQQGASRAALLEYARLTPEQLANPDVRLSYNQYARIIRKALELTGNPALGLDVGRNMRVPQMGVLALAIVSSPTVGASLEAAIRYGRAIAPAWKLGLRLEGSSAFLTAEEAIPLAPYQRFSTEVLLFAMDTQGRQLTGRAMPVKSCKYAVEEPPYSELYRQIYDVPMTFGAPITEIELDPSILYEKIAFADPATAKLAEDLCSRIPMPPGTMDGLIGQMRRLMNTPRGRPPTVEELARALDTSTRALRRSLQELGTSYMELLDQCRSERAEEWVRATQMTFEEIAERLGFSNVRSFRRAFKRWTGRTPGEFRAGTGAGHVAPD